MNIPNLDGMPISRIKAPKGENKISAVEAKHTVV